jgi:Tol biopolymer transport system component
MKIGIKAAFAVLGVLTVVGAAAAAAQATAPGKNGRIVFRRYLDVAKTRAAIFTVNPDGTKAKRVTHPPARVIDTEPDWSPNGAKIAFERQRPCPAGGPKSGLNNTCDLVYTVKRDGKGLKSLVACGFKADVQNQPFPGNCVGVDQPAWSPDGSKVAFLYNLADPAYTGSLNLNAGVWIVSADGTGLHQVTQRTPGTSWDSGPQWSPDGSKLVFARFDFTTKADAVFTVKVDGSSPFQVTPWTLNGGNSPDWSPDGQWLLFRGAPADGSLNVEKIHPDGTGLANLTNEPPTGHQYASSSFSPDGTMITTARTRGTGPQGAADVFVMRANGSNIRPVTRTRLWDSGTDWGTAPLR